MTIARLALILHKLPSEIRSMTLTDLDAITYLLHCDKKKSEQEHKIAEAKSKMK